MNSGYNVNAINPTQAIAFLYTTKFRSGTATSEIEFTVCILCHILGRFHKHPSVVRLA
jgi:hypothetical protein